VEIKVATPKRQDRQAVLASESEGRSNQRPPMSKQKQGDRWVAVKTEPDRPAVTTLTKEPRIPHQIQQTKSDKAELRGTRRFRIEDLVVKIRKALNWGELRRDNQGRPRKQTRTIERKTRQVMRSEQALTLVISLQIILRKIITRMSREPQTRTRTRARVPELARHPPTPAIPTRATPKRRQKQGREIQLRRRQLRLGAVAA
jgi:hypothetical protein